MRRIREIRPNGRVNFLQTTLLTLYKIQTIECTIECSLPIAIGLNYEGDVLKVAVDLGYTDILFHQGRSRVNPNEYPDS